MDRFEWIATAAFGLEGLVARELARRNITANAVAPGFIATDMTKALVELVNRAAYRDAAAQMGARLQQEHGILTAADIVEQEVRGWR